MPKFHRIIECAGLEGTHRVQLLALPSTSSGIPLCTWEYHPNTPWILPGLGLEEFAILHPTCKQHKHHRNVGLHTSFHLAWNHKKPWKRFLTWTFLMVKQVWRQPSGQWEQTLRKNIVRIFKFRKTKPCSLAGRSENLDTPDILDAWEETVCTTKKSLIKQNHYWLDILKHYLIIIKSYLDFIM